ncbi:hypothetical protein O1611_g3924 [Lasiodiplodia mahajangana]|uniref:Uncharacterized protein n=1 Tax=Lasiodiplodia mahajangana TaxID=1108764 RepID=A0ACC2JQK8_9PEZI|nr:hypothetical protein O1611_g3924 [Lasiodiplodia mahajangana]
MSSKRSKATTDDELGELFEGIGDDSAPKKPTKTKGAASKPRNDKPSEDILAELENELGGEGPARPHTPRFRPPRCREKGRGGTSSASSERRRWWGGIFATATATASAAMKQAEAAYKEIQQNEEAKKWAEQVRGNVGALRGLGKFSLLAS